MLYLIGLGLYDHTDISYKALQVVKKSNYVYLENYTSILCCNKQELESFYAKPVDLIDREFMENSSMIDGVLIKALTEDVSVLVVGDPFAATTHHDLFLRAIKINVKVKVIHNSSIINSVGECGLQLYKFGQIVSIVLFTENWRPTSFYKKIKTNKSEGLHTLCLLDIKVKERSEENLARDKKIYEPPRFMTISEAIEQLMEVEQKFKENICGPEALGIGVARLGSDNQKIISGTLDELKSVDFGAPLHSLIIVGHSQSNSNQIPREKIHDIEWDMLEYYSINKETVKKYRREYKS